MAWERHERVAIENIARRVNPIAKPKPDEKLCPTFHPGHGIWQYHAYEKMAYNELYNINANTLDNMFSEIQLRLHDKHYIDDQPFGDIRGEEDDFTWTQVLIGMYTCIISLRRRKDDYYDFCLTVFAKHEDTGIDVS
jgi:hypothetical protein